MTAEFFNLTPLKRYISLKQFYITFEDGQILTGINSDRENCKGQDYKIPTLLYYLKFILNSYDSLQVFSIHECFFTIIIYFIFFFKVLNSFSITQYVVRIRIRTSSE